MADSAARRFVGEAFSFGLISLGTLVIEFCSSSFDASAAIKCPWRSFRRDQSCSIHHGLLVRVFCVCPLILFFLELYHFRIACPL